MGEHKLSRKITTTLRKVGACQEAMEWAKPYGSDWPKARGECGDGDTLERVKALLVCQETATASEDGRACREGDPKPASGSRDTAGEGSR
jgi:hypothetical protein